MWRGMFEGEECSRTANMSALTGLTLVNSKLKRHSHWCLTRKP
jgi:hypothetical protein